MTTAPSGAPPAKRRGKARKIVLVSVVLLIVVIGALIALAPTIASSIAPGKIEQAAAAQIKGTVKVSEVSVGWFSPTKIGPVEIIDPEGKTAAKVTVNSPATLWRIVSERWWSAKKLDVGEVEVSAALDLIRDSATGVTNLQRALEPRTVAAKPAPGSGSSAAGGGVGGDGLESVKAAIKLTQLDAVVRDRDTGGKLSPELGIKGFKGTVNVDYAAKPMTLAAKADLAGSPVGSGSADPVKIKLDSSIKPKSGGGLESFDVKLDVAGAPIGLIDAVAGQGGALVQGIGPRADVNVVASGTPQAASAKIVLASEGAQANLTLALKDGVLTGASAESGTSGGSVNRIALRSTEFLASMPALRDALAKAGGQVKISKAPGVEITIEKLHWPLPQEMLSGGDAKGALAKQDFRGSGLNLKVHVDQMSGQVAIDQAATGAAQAPAWKSFAVEPIELTVAAADLAQLASITGDTKATIDGSPAGDVSVRATASGLLDAAGHLRALGATGLADNIEADVCVQGMSTALVQPLVAGMSFPVDLKQDIGPTLDLGLQAKADVKGVSADAAGKDLPPIDFALSMDSTNIKVHGAGRYAAGVVSLAGNGLTANIASVAPLAQRVLNNPGQPGALELSGVGSVAIKVTDFAAPVDKLKGADALAAIKGLINIEVGALGVKPSGYASEKSVQVSKAVLEVRLDKAKPPQVDLEAALTHEGSPFQAKGSLKLDGIVGGKRPSSAAGAAQIIAFKPAGKIEIQNAPRSLANLVAGAAVAGTHPIAPGEAMAMVAGPIRESIGRFVTLSMTTQPEGAAQSATMKLTTEKGGIGADLAAKLTEKALTVGTLTAFAAMDPATVNPALASSEKPAAGSPAAPALQLAQPFKLSLAAAEPITVPLKTGSFEPDFAGASDAAIKLSTDNDIAINNVPTGAGAGGGGGGGASGTTNVRVRSLKAEVRAPLAGLTDTGKGKRLTATFSAMAAQDGASSGGGKDGATIADVSGSASATMAGTDPDATIKLASIDCAIVENLIGKPGLLTGGLGDKAEANLRVQPTGTGASAATTISGTLTAPRVSDAKIDLTMTADRMAISKPSTITWRPDPAFINRMAFAPPVPAAGQAKPSSTIAVTQAAPITINITKFAMATSKTENGQPTVGPLKPGVFELDASITAPSLTLAATTQAGAPTPINLDGIKMSVRQQAGTGANAPPGGEVVADLAIDRVSGAAASVPAAGSPAPAATAAKKSTATVRISKLADARGVLTTSAAVINLDADLAAFPTPLIDQLAQQKGVLVELLGPTFDMQAQGRNLSTGGGGGGAGGASADLKNATGSLQVKAGSARASAEIQGDIQGGVFKQTGPVTAKIMQVTPQLIASLAGAVPVVDSVEKTPPDEPGRFEGKLLTIPIDGDMSKLSGDLEITPGVARFTTKSIFGTIIDALGGKTGGAIGQRLEAFKVHADHGVLTYDRFTLPVGQFSVETRGTVDLVRRQIDVVTYAPIGALTDKALGQLNTGIAGKLGIFDKLTMVPITTKGSIDSPKTELDLGLFAKEQADKLLKDPGKLIGDVLDIFGKKKGGEDGGQPTPAPAPTPVAPNTPKSPSSSPPANPQPSPKPKPPPKAKPKPKP